MRNGLLDRLLHLCLLSHAGCNPFSQGFIADRMPNKKMQKNKANIPTNYFRHQNGRGIGPESGGISRPGLRSPDGLGAMMIGGSQ
jgi:hypothetical protein